MSNTIWWIFEGPISMTVSFELSEIASILKRNFKYAYVLSRRIKPYLPPHGNFFGAYLRLRVKRYIYCGLPSDQLPWLATKSS